MTLREREERICVLTGKIQHELAMLGKQASKIYGKPLRADLCGDGEIEYRSIDDDFHVEVWLRDLEKMEKKQQQRSASDAKRASYTEAQTPQFT